MKKNIKPLKPLQLVLTLAAFIACLTFFAVSVRAEDEGTLNNFTANGTYNGFDDVSSTDWYYTNVQKAVELELMNGVSNGKFNPTGNITIAETIALASRIHSIYYTDSQTFDSTTPWYQSYVDYALSNGIITEDYTYTKTATRSQFALIMANALPESALPALNIMADGKIPDVSMTDYAADEIYMLFRAGIIAGNSKGYFMPTNSITRAEASAIVSRMALSDQRLGYYPTVNVDNKTTFGDLNHFSLSNNFSGFSDVKSTDWFYSSVQKSVEIGLMKGTGTTTFNPTGKITLAETIALASRIHCIYNLGTQSFQIGTPWYQTYVNYALENGIIDQEYPYTQTATRSQFAKIMANALPITALPTYNEMKDGGIPDVAMNDYAADEIYLLYRTGIVAGNTHGDFMPDNTISRAEASAIVSRMAIPEQRLGYDPLISTGDDSKKAIFKAKTINDFPSDLVINFDEQKDDNFGVLSEDVIRLSNSGDTNIAARLEDGTYILNNSDSAASKLKVGDVVKTIDENGTVVLFKIAKISANGNTLTITPASGVMLSEYYQYLKVNTTTTVGSAANVPAAASFSSRSSSPDISLIPGGLTFGAKLDNDNYTLGLTGTVKVSTELKIEYDPAIFGKDYFYVNVENTSTATAELSGSLKAGKEKGILTDELDLGRIPVQTTIPGVEIELELTLPIKFEAEASITGSIEIEQYDLYNYCSESGWNTKSGEDKDAKLEIKGKVTGSIGPKLEMNIAFLDDVMELGVEANLKAELTAETETAEKDDATGKKDSVHKCDLCIDGDLNAVFNIEFVLSLNVSEKTKLELVKYTFVEVKIHIADFYVSLKNSEDSIHQGKVAWGFFEECPNKHYRVGFKLVDETTGKPIPIPMDVFVNASDGSGTYTISSDEFLYLKAGYYGACVVDHTDLGEAILIQKSPQTVTLKAPAPDERMIYNNYLITEGFKTLNIIKDMKSKYMEVSTILVDLGGDDKKELVLKVINTQYSGPRGYETQYYLLTIDKNYEVVPVADCYYGSGTMGGDTMKVYLDTTTNKPVAAVDSVYREGIYANSVGRYIYTFNGTTADFSSAYIVNRISVDTYYEDTIAAVKKATKHYMIDSYDYFTYWTDLNDNYISETTYNSGYARYQASDDYAWVAGTVNIPIPETTK